MSPKAILFGSLGTLAETSDLRRRAYNAAFAEAGLDWAWDTPTFRRLLRHDDPIRSHAIERVQVLATARLAARAEGIYLTMLEQVRVPPRPGVRDVIDGARSAGVTLVLAAAASPEEAAAVQKAAGLESSNIDCSAAAPHVSPDLYLLAVRRMLLSPEDVVVIVDAPDAAQAAATAGLRCVAFPGAAYADVAFPSVEQVVDVLTPRLLGLPRRCRADGLLRDPTVVPAARGA
ncbi:HAD-IA family hydrolase [Roseitranquillus sediminis]|uniref:HAD-IA family hydrolase n=1 Tax=Roseitranquillus sediminis TaxID=2809051 RepID=UPI001D0CA425|nr:HAD-IA family hydrolase [Roseitranquillus sediminis]MBM9595341.1 HAD-IA family hydrolase [Roseitranquillus sediminis]